MLKDSLPTSLTDRDSIAYNLVPVAMNEIIGPKDDRPGRLEERSQIHPLHCEDETLTIQASV